MRALVLRSLTGSLLVVLILLLRAVLQEKLPKSTFRALWCVALVHLLLPKLPVLPRRLYHPVQQPIYRVVTEGLLAPEYWGQAAGAQSGGDPLFWFWLAGAVLVGIYFLLGVLRLQKRIRSAVPIRDLTAGPHIRLLAQENCPPMAAGLLRPVILLPESHQGWSAAERDMILAHERAHIIRGDLWLKGALALCAALYWFSPMVWLMLRQADRDIELACDAAVLHRIGYAQKAAYAMTLLGMESRRAAGPPLAGSFAKTALEARILAIMKSRKHTRAAVILSVALCLTVTVIFAAERKAAVEPAPSAPAETVPAVEAELTEMEYGWPHSDSRELTMTFGTRVHPITGETHTNDHICIGGAGDCLAMVDGRVIETGFAANEGNFVRVEHENGMVTAYGHLAEIHVTTGDTVTVGQALGTVGNTGAVTGTCLSVWIYEDGEPVDPMGRLK